MQPDDYMKLDQQLCFAFYTCSREIMKLYRPLLSPHGLTYTQYITLLSLWERDGVTVKELGATLFLDSGTLTPLLKKLESMNLITRTRDKADERNVIIELTEIGHALKEQVSDVPKKLYADTKVRIEDITAMREQIQSFLRKMGEVPDES
ncbi:MarR family winged helix-turn-helix transcriptional regulator [Paenibacillus sp. DYY-L-2]|uniref:MarR family winged helix-turn-helix transcriptional regulator n=1 Tax=Paenibacillus sp. DYY-L-2 TaxID=3447013 RepID=UPI003F50223D